MAVVYRVLLFGENDSIAMTPGDRDQMIELCRRIARRGRYQLTQIEFFAARPACNSIPKEILRNS